MIPNPKNPYRKYFTKNDEENDGEEIIQELSGDNNVWSKFLTSGNLSLFFYGSLDTESFRNISDELKQYEIEDEKGIQLLPFTLFLTSSGGDASLVKCFYPILHSMGMRALIGISQTSSAAFQIMLECKKNKLPVYIDPMCHVVVHRCISTIVTEERSDRIHDYNENWVKKFESVVDKMNETLFRKLGKECKRNYDLGLNVYLLGSDLIEAGIFEEYKKGII